MRLKFSICAGVASTPSRFLAGSKGDKYKMVNTNVATPTITMKLCKIRSMINCRNGFANKISTT